MIIQWCHLVGKNHPRAQSKTCLSIAVMVTCRRQCHRNSPMYNLKWQQIPRNRLFPGGKDRVVLWVSGCSCRLAAIITHIFQQSYNTSKLPDDWLQALVTPIHKKSLKSDPANYRTISLTCILCKVMEHIILSNMWKHLHKHNILLHFQNVFQSGLVF